MNIDLSERYVAIIRNEVSSGRFSSESDVVRAALLEMENQSKLARLQAMVAEGDAEIAAGNVYEWTDSSMEELMEEAREAHRRNVLAHSDVAS